MRKLGLLIAVVPTLVAQSSSSPCDLNGDGVVNVADVQLAVNEALGMSACTMNLDGTGSCDIADVQRIIAAALGGTCQVTGQASSNITLPIEVMGSAGTTNSATFNIPSSSSSLLGGTQTLSLQIHGLKYQTEASVQVNNSTWTPINSSTVTLQGLASAYGGIGGGFHTLTMTMSLPAGTVTTGNNTITFKFNGTDGITSGYRVLALNVVGSDGSTQLVPSSAFVWDNPNNWQPPSSAASDIAAGETLYTSATLTVPNVSSGGTSTILAHCSDCHAVDGRDLKYFNYSNNSIAVRSQFHGLSAQQGNQIASYIRSLNVPNPGRPWNPPYQPGPGMDSLPVTSWAAGAGIGAVLASDAGMQPFLMPNGSTTGWASTAYLNPRELPIALQLPDWNTWLPQVHPMDAFGSSFTGSTMNTTYAQLRGMLQPNNQASYKAAVGIFGNWLIAAQEDFLQNLESGNFSANNLPQTLYSAALWMMVKEWELNQEFGLEGMPQAAYGAKANARGWYGNMAFFTSPNMLHIPEGSQGIANGTQVAWLYLAFAWYHTQLILNDGQGEEAGNNPMDYGYVNGMIKSLSNAANGTPEAMLQMAWLVKALQEYTLNGTTPVNSQYEFVPTQVQGLILAYNDWNQLWSATPAATRTTMATAYLQYWFAQLSSFPNSTYYQGTDGGGRPYASATDVPANDQFLNQFGGQLWWMLPRFRYIGVSPTLTFQVSAWAATLFPAGNWALNNAATCHDLGSCTSD
jgi:cytochrome c553